MLAHPRQVPTDDGGSDVERREVVAQGRPPSEPHEALLGIDTGRRRENDLGAGAPGERHHVDLQLRSRVLTGDEARHHARVDGNRLVEHHGCSHVPRTLHGEAAQDLDVRVAATDQDQMRGRGFSTGRRVAHGGRLVVN